jgi:hypothetical protein
LLVGDSPGEGLGESSHLFDVATTAVL